MKTDFGELEKKLKAATLMGYDRLNELPTSAGVYAAWYNDEPHCLYVGKALKSLKKRIGSHFRGTRGGDQFCVYVYDKFIHNQRCELNRELKSSEVDKLVGEWVQRHVRFRWIDTIQKENIGPFEDYLRQRWRPILNALGENEPGSK